MPGPRSSVGWAPPTIFTGGQTPPATFHVGCAMRTIFGGGSLCHPFAADALPWPMFPRTAMRPVRRLLIRSRSRAPPPKPNGTRTRPMVAWRTRIPGRAFQWAERGERT